MQRRSGVEPRQGRGGEMIALSSRVLGYTANFTTLQVAACAQARSMELVDNAHSWVSSRAMTAEIGYGSYRHGCAIDDGKKGQSR